MKYSLTLITGSEQTRKSLFNQLKELIPTVNINSYALDEGIENIINDELVVVSSLSVKKELEDKKLLSREASVIIANRTISYDKIDEIILLPKGTKALLVNDVEESARESIENLKSLGIDHIKLYPYYPGVNKKYEDIKIAITPGESDKVPSYIEKTYDIHPRVIDLFSITKIIYSLNIVEEQCEKITHNYLLKIVNLTKKLWSVTANLQNTNFYLSTVISGLNKGFLLYSNNGNIKVFNDELKDILNVKMKFIIGNTIKNVLKNNLLIDFLNNDSVQELLNFKYNERIININKIRIENYDLNLAIFDSSEIKTISRSILDKGLVAKYDFDDIIGESQALEKVKSIAKRLATSDLTILIEGESGTGKELFASSIHRWSNRSSGPFLAVNFSALPEELMESELFGYEEGAFTGAKKGGKKGLFEEADGGTIFLDEIGDISLRLQTRLLRVLQEKEIMKVGGNSIKKIDVRIIAATNRDLYDMISKKMFREDLYYRLKMGYIKIPALRQRREDIPMLVDYFISCDSKENIDIEEEVMAKLKQERWYGNVRELKNAINYMLAITEKNKITVEHIPDYIVGDNYGSYAEIKNRSSINSELNFMGKDKEKVDFILKVIEKCNKSGKLVGRDLVAAYGKEQDIPMTISYIRNKMDELQNLGYIVKGKGKHGTKITEKGLLYLEKRM